MADNQQNWWEQDAQAPTGDAFLKTLPPERAAQVKALSDGRMELPKGQALRSPVGQQMLADVATYDPNFDVANASSRIANRKAFTSGKQGQNIASFNTALGHLGTLAQRAEALDNGHFPLWNSIANSAETATGDPRVSNFNIARAAVADELTRAFRGTGGNVADIKEWQENIHAAQSPAQLRGAIKQAADLLHSRVTALGDEYSKAMGVTSDPFELLSPHARDALSGFESNDYETNGYKAPPAAIADPTLPHDSGGGAGPGSASDGSASANPRDYTPPKIISADGSATFSTADDKQFAAETRALLAKHGATRADFDALAAKHGRPPFNASLDAAIRYRDRSGKQAAVSTPVSGHKEATILSKVAGSGVGAAGIAAGNTATFGVLPKAAAGVNAIASRLDGDDRDVGAIYNENLGQFNENVETSAEAHPVAALAGDVAGFIGGDGVLAAVPGVAKLAAKTPSLLRPVVGDALFGTATGVGSSDHLSDVPGAVLRDTALSAGGGLLGRGIAKGAAGLLSPVVTGAARRLTDAGVTLTPGQLLGAGGSVAGKAVKRVEDAATGFPIVGDMINSTRRAGVEDFNLAALNEQLGKSGLKLPQGIKAGHSANDAAIQAADKAYADALAPLTLSPDAKLATDLAAPSSKVASMGKDQQLEFGNALAEHVTPYLPANATPLTGENLQAIKQGLDTEIATYRKSSAPNDRKLADRLGEVRDAYLSLADRGAPAEAEAYRNARATYAGIQRVVDAASRTKDGVFTPNQYRQAIGRLGYGTTKRGLAAGTAPGQQLATDASTVLPSAVPDSGTAGRAAVGLLANRATGGALLGGAAGGYYEGNGGGALSGAVVGGALLSQPGARATQWLLAGSRGRVTNTLGDLLRRNAELGGAVGTPLLLGLGSK